MIFTRTFWLDATERCVKTFAQALLAVIGATTFDWWNASWAELIGSAGIAALISLLTSLVSAKATDRTVSPASVVPRDRGAADLYLLWLVALTIAVTVLWVKVG